MKPSALIAMLTLAGCLLNGCTKTEPAKPRVPWPPSRPGYVSPIAAENQLAGDPNFYDGREATANQIEGYADHTSAHAGDTVQLMVSSDGPHAASWSLYRLGWYGGARARKAVTGNAFTVGKQAACPISSGTGLVRCAWLPSFSYVVRPDDVSGLYVFKFVRDDGFTSFAPLVITDDRPADILLQASVDTYQAYSAWQGESLYADSSGTVNGGMATQVSFDRPYASDRGSGQMLRYEALFAGYLEKYGYDVTYTTNPQVAARGAALLLSHGLFLSVGHDEYWSPGERDALDSARDQNVPILFFGANVGYWKVRYESSPDPTNPRVITCYKTHPEADPDQGAGRTGLYRDAPTNRPENELVGTMYESYVFVSGQWTVADPTSFLYAGTGLQLGDALPFLVGYEYDNMQNNGFSPKGATVVARSPVVDAYGRPSWSEAVVYHGINGSLVFGAGSIEWAYGLGQPGVADVRVERMTANVLQEALHSALPVPAALTGTLVQNGLVFSPPPATSSATTIGRGMQTPTGVALLPDGSFVAADPTKQQIFHGGPTAADPVTVIAGDGVYSKKPQYDNVAGAKARFYFPTSLLVLPNGDIIVADTSSHSLRRIANDGQHTVSTVAGTRGSSGYANAVGTAARFKDPMGLAFDPRNGDILVADSGNARIRRVNPATWSVTTEAGAGFGQQDGPALTARFTNPTAVAMAADGRLFVVSSGDYRVVMIGTDPQRLAVTIAGGKRGVDDGTGDKATLSAQGGAVWDGMALLVSEPAVNRIRRIVPGTNAATTTVEVVAGNGRFGSVDGTGGQVLLASPLGLALAPNGSLVVANGGDGTVRTIQP
jgi:hypothetical protein